MGVAYQGVDNLDIQNGEPTEREAKSYGEVGASLDRKQEVMTLIEEYTGCQELARAAMSSPSPETEKAAFEGLLGAVESISVFFNYSKTLEQKTFPTLLSQLGSSTVEGNLVHIDEQPGLTKQLADLINFALEFDRVRMLRPNLSNDFSYYRRLLPKFSKHESVVVKDDEAGGMALFTAEHIPMISCLAKSGSKVQEDSDNASLVLCTLANSCHMILKRDKDQLSPDASLYLARTMAGSIVLFDHIDPLGAFHKRSPICLKPAIILLSKDFAMETSLLNAIRFSTKNFRDAPEAIQNLFD